MSKKIMVVVLAILLTGCVEYTNDKNERCTVSLDPSVWIVEGIETMATGETGGHISHYCRPKN